MIGHPLDRYRIKSKLGEGDFEPFEVTRLAGLGSGGANQFEGMRPALLPKAWNAPELAERLDGTRRCGRSHVRAVAAIFERTT